MTPVCSVILFTIVRYAYGDATCKAGDGSCYTLAQNVTDAGAYYWPMAMGHPQYYSNPPWPGPTDLQSTFRWSWFGPTKRYEESFVGAVIDDKKNIYVNGHKAVYKLNPHGRLIWASSVPQWRGGSSASGLVLYKGGVIGSTFSGEVFSLDMVTSQVQWIKKPYDSNGGEYSHFAAHNGVLITKGTVGQVKCYSAPWEVCSGHIVKGLNATDGEDLWAFEPGDGLLWDFFPQFPDDESTIFMTHIGSLYRMNLQTGAVIWKAAGTDHTWTDGSQFVAANGLTYSVNLGTPRDHCGPRQPGVAISCTGYVTAYRTSDGSFVWRAPVPKPPHTTPAVGRLGKDDKLSLVMGIGQQSEFGCEAPYQWIGALLLPYVGQSLANLAWLAAHKLSLFLGDENWRLWGSSTRTHDVHVFDAETGAPLWTWSGATSHRKMNRGDEDGILPRNEAGIRLICCPTPWGQPRIATDGTIVIPNENGDLYAIRDANGDNKIDNDKEVQVFHTGATFPHCGTAHAPDLMVAVNFDGVFAWASQS